MEHIIGFIGNDSLHVFLHMGKTKRLKQLWFWNICNTSTKLRIGNLFFPNKKMAVWDKHRENRLNDSLGWTFEFLEETSPGRCKRTSPRDGHKKISETFNHPTFQVPKMEESSPMFQLYGYGFCEGVSPPPKIAKKKGNQETLHFRYRKENFWWFLSLEVLVAKVSFGRCCWIFFFPRIQHYIWEVSKNRGGPPKWMVKIMENPY